MKKLFIAMAIFCALPARLFGQLQVNPENFEFVPYNGEAPKIVGSTLLAYKFSKHWGVNSFLYGELEDKARWYEATVGPAFFSECMDAGVMLGGEWSHETGNGLRLNAWTFVHSKNDAWSLLVFYEYGYSTPFLRTEGQRLLWKSKKETKEKRPVWKLTGGYASHGTKFGEALWLSYKKFTFVTSPFMWNWEIGEPLFMCGVAGDFR